MANYYITTAIDYVNSAPHLGHAYEKILTDIIARYQRLKGNKVFFVTGTDENAKKNELAAKEAKLTTKDFVDLNSKKLFLPFALFRLWSNKIHTLQNFMNLVVRNMYVT